MKGVKIPAAALVAMLMLWAPSGQADTSFSFRIYGGDHHGYSHRHGFHGGFHHGYPGYRRPYVHRYGYRRGHRLYPRYRPHPWHYGYSYRWRPRYNAPGPRCIHQYGTWYCR